MSLNQIKSRHTVLSVIDFSETLLAEFFHAKCKIQSNKGREKLVNALPLPSVTGLPAMLSLQGARYW
jgi:hypothetical protein